MKTIDRTFDIKNVNKDDNYSFYKRQNSISVDPLSESVKGERYKTFAEAFAYIATQSPSALSTWTVEYDGIITENLSIPEFVFVNGKDKNTSKLMGDTTFMAPGTYESNMILNSTINNLVVDNSTLPPLPVMYTPMAVFQPYNPDTYEYGFGGSLGGDYGIQFQVNGVTYDTGLVIADSAPAATIQAAIVAIDPVLFGSVTVSGSDPANSTVTMTLDGLPYLTSDYIKFYSISGVFNPPTAIASVGDGEIQASILSALPTGGNIELTLDYNGTTFSSGVLTYAPDMHAVLTAGMNTILTDIQTAFHIDNGVGRIQSGVLDAPGIGFVFYVMFEGFMGAVPVNINIVPGTYTWESLPSFTYSIENCIINDTSMAGANNLAKINNSTIYGGDWDGHATVAVYKSLISPVIAPIHFRTDTNIFHCNFECSPYESLTLTDSTIFLCSIVHPQYLTLLVSARLRQSTFSFGSLIIPNGTNCKSFGSFYIDPVIVNYGGWFTSHCDILEQGHEGGGTWDSLVGATFDPSVKGILSPTTWETQDAIDELTDMIGAMSSGNDIIWSLSTDPTYEDLYTNHNIASRTAPFKILLADGAAIYKIGCPSGTPYANNNLITFESLGNPTTKPRLLFEGDWAGVQSTSTYACLNGVEVYNNITTATTSPFKIIGDSSKVGIIPPQMINSTITQSAGCIAPLFTYIVPSTTYMNMLLVNSSMDNGGASRPVFDIIEASPNNTLNIDCYEYDSSSVAQDVFGSLTNDSTIIFKIESNCSAVLNQFGMHAKVSISDNASKVLINDVYNINNIPVTDVERLVTKAAIQTYKWDASFEQNFSDLYDNKQLGSASLLTGNRFIDLVNGTTFNLDPANIIARYTHLNYYSLRGAGKSICRIGLTSDTASDSFFSQLHGVSLVNSMTSGNGFVISSSRVNSKIVDSAITNDSSATVSMFKNVDSAIHMRFDLDNSTISNLSSSSFVFDSSNIVPVSIGTSTGASIPYAPDRRSFFFSDGYPTGGTYDLVIMTLTHGVISINNIAYNETAGAIKAMVASQDAIFTYVDVLGSYDSPSGLEFSFWGTDMGEITGLTIDTTNLTGPASVSYTDTAGNWQTQQVTLTPNIAPNSGELVLRFNGADSDTINYSDNSSDIQTALQAIPDLSSVVVTDDLISDLNFKVEMIGVHQTNPIVPIAPLYTLSCTLEQIPIVGSVSVYLHNGSTVIGEISDPTTPLTIYYDNTSFYDVQTNPLASYQPLSDHNKDLNLQGGDIMLDEFYHLSKQTYDELNPIFSDEFLGIQRGEWSLTTGSVGTSTFVEQATGWIKDETGTTSGDFMGYDFDGYKCFRLNNLPMIKTRVQVSDLTESKVEIGLKNAAGDKYVKFIYDDSVDRYWRFVADDGNGHVETGVYAENIGNPDTLLCKSSFGVTTAPIFDIYINGALQGSIDLIALDASFFNEYLEPFRLVTTLTTDSTAKDCTYDYIKIWQTDTL